MPEYGVQFRDKSVYHPWNGRTALQHAQERAAENPAEFTVVTRKGPGCVWMEWYDLPPSLDPADVDRWLDD